MTDDDYLIVNLGCDSEKKYFILAEKQEQQTKEYFEAY